MRADEDPMKRLRRAIKSNYSTRRYLKWFKWKLRRCRGVREESRH